MEEGSQRGRVEMLGVDASRAARRAPGIPSASRGMLGPWCDCSRG
jgi:hypothetical protein